MHHLKNYLQMTFITGLKTHFLSFFQQETLNLQYTNLHIINGK